jgi:hypothetical protein
LTDTQFYIYVTVVPVSTIIIVLGGVLLNNVNMNARFRDINTSFPDIDRRFAEIKDLIQACLDRQDGNFRRFEDKMLGKFAELDTRLSRIEHHLNLG